MDEPMRQKIMSLLEQNRIMTIATLRPDGWPQATTVGFSHEGLTLYFLCGTNSQKALNLARYPEQRGLNMPMPSPTEIALFKVWPKVISVLDYSKEFGHTDLVEC